VQGWPSLAQAPKMELWVEPALRGVLGGGWVQPGMPGQAGADRAGLLPRQVLLLAALGDLLVTCWRGCSAVKVSASIYTVFLLE